MTSEDIQQIQAAIAALEAQRAVLGDQVVDTALAPLREKLMALTRAAPPTDERKRVTVLFSDLAGFTAMSETMDPEEVHEIIDAYFARMNPAITRYSGTIEKYIGDAVMALFGAPKALENQEEMAVRAALAMHGALEEFNRQLERERGLRLAMRIGVNTGLVLYGSMGGRVGGDFTVTGDTVNLASRLESACPVGRVMVSAETARHLHAIFDFEPPQQITVKGKTEPITVYVVIGERAQRGRVRGVTGLYAPMVGRDEELESLQAAFEQAATGPRWQMAAVVGEAGIGKSRLRREFIAWATQARPQTRLLVGRCYAHTQNTPYHLAAELMRGLLNVGGDAGAAIDVAQLAETLRALDPAIDETEQRYRLGSLASVLGFSLPDDPLQALEPEQRRDRTFLSLERLLLTASATVPLLAVVEDLHWADVLSLSFIERLIQEAANGPGDDGAALLLLISRPAEDAQSPLARLLQRTARPPHRRLALRPLDAAQSGTLIAKLLNEAGLPPDVVSLVLERAQGNPFFVEEILRSFIEDGTLARDPSGEGWQVTRAVEEVEVPDTVQGVMAARMDRLPTDDKRIVRHAAIIGRTFWQQLLSDVAVGSGGLRAEGAAAVLSRLETRQLVVRLSESQIADDWEWLFRHVLAQEVAYASVPRAVRRRVHARVARWLESNVDGRTASFVPLIAYHYEQAAIPGRAVDYLRRAGDQAAAQFANEDAVDYFGRALRALEQVDRRESTWMRDQKYAALLGREGVYGLMGRREAQAQDLAALRAMVEEMDDDRRKARVHLRHAAYFEATSDFPAALEAAHRAIRCAERADDPQQKIEGLVARARALWRQGSFDEARDHLEEALALARQHGDRRGEATSLHYLGTVVYVQGDYRGARDQLERALAIRRELGDRQGEATSLSNLVGVYHDVGDFGRGRECARQALTIYQTIGDRMGEAHALSNLGQAHQALGALATARELHQRSLTLRRATDDRGGEALTLENLALVLCDLGDYRGAQRHCERALEIERAIGDRQGEGYSLTYLGLALEGLEKWEAAGAAYSEALRLRREIGQDALAIDDLAGLARVALNQIQDGDEGGDGISRALHLAEEALAWIAAQGVHGIEYPLRVYLTGARVLSAAGQGERATALLEEAQTLLQEQATRISDPSARQAFLEDVPLHRQLRERDAP